MKCDRQVPTIFLVRHNDSHHNPGGFKCTICEQKPSTPYDRRVHGVPETQSDDMPAFDHPSVAPVAQQAPGPALPSSSSARQPVFSAQQPASLPPFASFRAPRPAGQATRPTPQTPWPTSQAPRPAPHASRPPPRASQPAPQTLRPLSRATQPTLQALRPAPLPPDFRPQVPQLAPSAPQAPRPAPQCLPCNDPYSGPPGHEPVICGTCMRKMGRPYFRRHMNSHHGERRFPCRACDTNEPSAIDLREHRIQLDEPYTLPF